jgi:ATP-binding cassette, subfamily B, multidrug efflux pump
MAGTRVGHEVKGGERGDTRARTEAILRAFHEEAVLGKAYDAEVARRLWAFVKPYRRLLWISLGLGFLVAALALLRPYLMQLTIDDGVMAGDRRVLYLTGSAFALVILLEQVVNFVQVYSIQIVGARSMADLRTAVFSFLHSLGLSYFDRQPVGRLVTRVTNDVDAVQELFASGALNALVDLVRLVGIVIVMVILDWRLSLIAFAATPVVGLLVRYVRRKSRKAFREIRAKTARMNATMNEQISGMAVVQAFGQEQSSEREFDEINAAYRDANMSAIKYEAIQDAAIEMVAAVCLASIVVSLGYRSVSFGTLVAFNAYLLMFFEPITALAQRYTLLQSAMAGAERVFGLLDVNEPDAPRADVAMGPEAAAILRDEEISTGREPVRASSPADAEALAFEGVSFSYKPGVPVLSNVSFRVRPGEKVALVGPTGAGKTTVVSLLLRLYDATEGAVRVLGKDVRAFDRTELRRAFSVVPQDVFLFTGTVLENIALGDANPDVARATNILRQIQAYELLMRRPGGLSAPVDERGENFSAGERQLIAFARALYRDAPIVILDEATASVDSDTEARLHVAMEALMRDRTAIVIAHRLSTIRSAHRVLVFRQGRLAEQGSHQELLEQGGLYAKLHQLHFGGTGS